MNAFTPAGLMQTSLHARIFKWPERERERATLTQLRIHVTRDSYSLPLYPSLKPRKPLLHVTRNNMLHGIFNTIFPFEARSGAHDPAILGPGPFIYWPTTVDYVFAPTSTQSTYIAHVALKMTHCIMNHALMRR